MPITKGNRSQASLAYHGAAFLFQDSLPIHRVLYLLWFEKAQLGRCWHSRVQRILPPCPASFCKLRPCCVWEYRYTTDLLQVADGLHVAISLLLGLLELIAHTLKLFLLALQSQRQLRQVPEPSLFSCLGYPVP